MAGAVDFKSVFNDALVRDLSHRVGRVWSSFNEEAFKLAVPVLNDLAMKDRVRAISNALHATLPQDYAQALPILMQAVTQNVQKHQPALCGFPAWVPLQFVEDYGLGHAAESMQAMEQLTQQFSAEFAIRPYLLQQPEYTWSVLHDWCTHPSDQVRRLVSEGSRPRLPWAQQLPPFIEDPSPVFHVLGKLIDDPSEFVRRSVANNLNDIAKDNPNKVLEQLVAWRHGRENAANFQWICRHGLRSLIKQGNPEALALLGYENQVSVHVERFEIFPAEIALGEHFNVVCELASTAENAQRVVIDYAIHFQKKRGTSRRVSKWSKKDLLPEKSVTLAKKHHVVPVSVRKYYSGEHLVELLVNGKVLAQSRFQLKI